MKISHAQYSHVGSRTVNQDAIGCDVRGNRGCFVVSDGIAGRPGGDTASQLAVSAALAKSAATPYGTDELLRACIAEANDAIVARQRHDPALREMAATIVALLVDSELRTAQWAHVGDSRLYRFRRGQLVERTRDHSLVQQLADAGLPCDGLSPGLLLHALGMTGEVLPGLSSAISVEDGDAFLLCTDGFWQLLPDELIEYCLRAVHTVSDWLTLLADAIRQRSELSGSVDNCSALAVWIGNPESVTLVAMR
jgi:serine/threonine protein phosphatase PrpC